MDDLYKIRIIELALDMLLRRGVRSFRVDDLAREAGISKRTLYEVFKDKEDIVRHAAYLFFEKEEQEYNKVGLTASNFVESLILVLKHVSNTSQDTWQLRDDLQKYYNPLFTEVITSIMKRRLESMVLLFNIGVEQGYVRGDIDLRLSIVTMQQLFKVLSQSRDEIVKVTSLSHVDAANQLIISYFRGICTSSAVALMDEYILKNK